MFDENSKIVDLLKSEEARRVMNQYLSGIAENSKINMVKGFSLRTLCAFPQVKIPKEKFDLCIEELKKL